MRKSKRELESDLEELTSDHEEPDLGRPFTVEERTRLEASGLDVDGWGQTRQRRAVCRALAGAAAVEESS